MLDRDQEEGPRPDVNTQRPRARPGGVLMPWLRTGDNVATNPRLLRVYDDPDASTSLVIEAFGFLVLCASLAAAHTTDYVVSWGTACLIARDEAPRLLDVCVRAGLMEEATVDGERVWKIVDDPEFLHMRSKEEIEWEHQRKNDNSRPDLIIPVRLRDGDACRYCAKVVKFAPGARKGRIVGTYDHRQPGKAATVETMVVACSGCNAGRKNDPLADERYPLLPPPSKPYFSPYTRTWIREHPWARDNGYSITSRRGRTIPPGTVPDDRKTIVEQHQRPATQADTATDATRQPAGHREPTRRPGTRPDTATTTATSHPVRERDTPQRPAIHADNAHPPHPPTPAPTPVLPDTADPAEHLPPGSGSAGSGRVGSGRVGMSGNPPPDPNPPSRTHSLPSPTPRRRGRRGKNRKAGH
ncbi:hypothetical protein F8M49_22365 [Rhodococcus zopfii]|uniref:HNH endonuclease n=1 Tax=Rhodococcus zopfii TaxID=43772 RepID=A0ABU3WTY7_9NOCA|nr:hypothetical protein [Rhodococcus zopfii]